MSNGMSAGNEPRQPRRVREPSLPDAIIPLVAADSATVTSPLIAWNSCGAFMGALSVPYGITGFKIEKTGLSEAGLSDTQFPEPITAGPSADEPAQARQEAAG